MQTHTIAAYRPDYLPAHVSNGLVGLRIGQNPLVGNTAMLNGYFGLHEDERVESIDYIPYPLGGDIRLDNLWLSQRPDLLTFREQSYDFSCGELTTKVDFTANGVTAHLEVLTLCSRTMPTLCLQEVRVTVDAPCTLTLRAGIEPAGVPGQCRLRTVPQKGWLIADGALWWESRGGIATAGLAYISACDAAPPVRDAWGYQTGVTTDYTIAAAAGTPYVLRQYASAVPSISHSQPDAQAIRLVRTGVHQSFDELRADNRAAWADIWRGRIRLLGADPKWQQVTDAAYFYLHSSVHFAAPCSAPAFGLGHRRYGGNIMWDAETYMFPTVLLTAPRAARSMLDFRTRTRDAARRNAALYGFDGLMYTSGGRQGEDMVASWAASVFIEQHNTLEVAMAFAQYAQATGDRHFLRESAWPALRGVAEYVVSRVQQTARGYEIRHVTGVDEEIENIHNNAYTNLLAMQVLREASVAAAQLGEEIPAAWGAIVAGMFLPIDPASRALLKHDAYVDGTYRFYNPETLVALFPFDCPLPADVRQATLDYDLARAASYLGNPLMSPFFAVLAARAGRRDFAADLLERGVLDYVVDPFFQFVEYPEWGKRDIAPLATPYLSNLGAYLMSALYGLPGLQLSADDPAAWCTHPVAMPAGWDGIAVDHLTIRGHAARLTARQGDERAHIAMLAE